MPLQYGLLAILLSIGPLAQAPSAAQRIECRNWRDCRQLALDALASGDYERFHDLAWKTVQTGPPRDPDLMFLLARAQSLSGRPHDALVMLGRLAEMGVAADVTASDEFQVVRTLPGWPAVEALIAAAERHIPTDSLKASSAPSPPAGADLPAPPPGAPSASRAPVVAPRPASPSASSASSASSVSSSSSLFTAVDAVRVPAAALSPTGLSYDRVSGRFVVADRHARKLVIIDERSRHVVDLVGAESAGFHEITALEIDPRRGELWVVSAATPGTDSQPVSVLHKVQLVSGRPLAALPLPEAFGAARFDDVAVSEGGTVFVLDGLGGRIFRLGTDQHTFVVVAAAVGLGSPTSIAPSDDRTVYVAHADGIVRLDVATGAVTPLSGPRDVQLTGFERLRWDRDSLIGIQRLPDGTRRVVSIRLSRAGGRPVSMDVIAPDVSMPDPMAATLSEHVFYFVTDQPQGSGAGPEIIVRRAQLR
jgi:hypothetical protein